MSQKDQKQNQSQVLIQRLNSQQQVKPYKRSKKLKPSAFTTTYENLMDNEYTAKEKVKQTVDQSDSLKTKYPFKKLPIVKLIPERNLQNLFIDVHYGHFKTTLSLFFVDKNSQCHKNENNQQGNFGTIYESQLLGQRVAIKCLKYKTKQKKKEQNFGNTLINVLIEVVIMLKASSLKAGPYYPEQAAGFHIIVYKECIQFMMEFCKCIDLRKEIDEAALKRDLQENLAQLHQHKIIHFDIKQQNIAFSPKYQRFVFLDFGLSQIVEQPFGFLTQTKFRGSLRYCSKQMKKLYQFYQNAYIDLYYNDAHCLKQTLVKIMIARMENGKTFGYQPFSDGKFINQNKDHYLIILKRLFFFSTKEQEIQSLLQKHQTLKKTLKDNKKKILKYILSLRHFQRYRNYIKLILMKSPQQDCDFDYSQQMLINHFCKVYNHDIKQKEEAKEQYQFFRMWFLKVNQMITLINDLQNQSNTSLLRQLPTFQPKIRSILLFEQPFLAIYTQACNITSQNSSYEEKLKKLALFTEVLQIPCNISQGRENHYFLAIYRHCISPLTSQKVQIFSSVLISVVVLDMVAPQQLFDLISSIPQLGHLPQLSKLKAMLSIFSALYWVYTKIRTQLSYYQLMNAALLSLKAVLANLKQSNAYESLLKKAFSFLLKIIPQKQYFGKQEEARRLREQFKAQLEPALASLALSDSFCKRLLLFIELTLILKEYLPPFQWEGYLKCKDEEKLLCSIPLLNKRRNLDQRYNQSTEAAEKLFYALQEQDLHQYYMFDRVKDFQTDEQEAQVPTFVKKSTFGPKAYQRIANKLVAIIKSANIVDKVQIITVSLYRLSYLIVNRHLLQLTQLISLTKSIVDEIPSLVTSQNLVIKHKTAVFLKCCFKILKIQQQCGAIGRDQLISRKKWFFQQFLRSSLTQRCLKCKIQKLFYLSVQQLKICIETDQTELFSEVLISGFKFYIESGYIFELIHEVFHFEHRMNILMKERYLKIVAEMLTLVNLDQVKNEMRNLVFNEFMRCYFYLVCLQQYEQASSLCLKMLSYHKLSYQKQVLIALLYTIKFTFCVAYKLPYRWSTRQVFHDLSTHRFLVKNGLLQKISDDVILQHLQVCDRLIKSNNKYVSLFFITILQMVYDYRKFPVNLRPYLLKTAYSLNILDRYCKRYILSNYYIIYVLTLHNPELRKKNFLLKRSMYSRSEQSHIYSVLNLSYKGIVANQHYQKHKINLLIKKMKKLNENVKYKTMTSLIVD